MRLAFVLSNTKRLPSRAAVDEALTAYPGLGPATWLGEDTGEALSFEAGGVEVMVGFMPAPVPDGEADAAAEHSISGVTGQWTLPSHSTHLVCILRQGDSGLGEMVHFTRAVGAVARAAKAVGVYWGEGHATHHPELFIELAESDLPLPLWVGVSLAGDAQGVELLSIGMQQLGLPDLLLTAPVMTGPVLEFFYELLAYVTRRGEALPDGDTVGRSEDEHSTVKYVPSPVDKRVKVWRVQLGEAPAPRPATKRATAVKPPPGREAAAKKKPVDRKHVAGQAVGRKPVAKPSAQKKRPSNEAAARASTARGRRAKPPSRPR